MSQPDGVETRRDADAKDQSEAAYPADYELAAEGPDTDDVDSRSALLPEEQAAGGSADARAQAEIILEDSLLRTEVPGAAPASHLEHRRSEDTV